MGQSVTKQGVLPAAGESDWLQVTFSGEGNTSFHAHIQLTGNPNNAFAFDLASNCSGGLLGCTEGGNCAGKTDWETYYSNGNLNGSGPIPAVGTVYIRVYRVASGSPTCDQWTLTVSE